MRRSHADDGPETIALAREAAEAIRRINHLTIASDGGFTYPSEFESTIRPLSAAAYGVTQALRQVAAIADELLAEHPGLYDDRRPRSRGQGQNTLADALMTLAEAGPLAETLGRTLDRAAGCLSHLGIAEPSTASGRRAAR
ncbi:hypothetical protein [Pseudofrankia inefficax]|uniref:Uncharacterized protein n=1 Tax=Pseudofrankia inefficax (strain DSM 45817 / CECT 9037 / DDB 130130 / EuI1c) TaxID=298654 RepID=E3IX28_PSEI1|nr:hypothetical protein [Pseudofrankia inefficax]ADP83800.1 hypothetical protein FraEuI1c_5816 [Pseudofrankia inefficax]